MEVRRLGNTSIELIIDCFLEAFDGYYVKMPTDRTYYHQRWTDANVDFSRSYGMFDNDLLVGFILHIIDNRFGRKTIYNAGTGVIPKYRGRQIINSIYQWAVEDFRKEKIEIATLEVITDNIKAIKTYKNAGFEICKTYLCFKGKLNHYDSVKAEIRELPFASISWEQLPNQEFYSWDNQKNGIPTPHASFYEVSLNDLQIGYFIINPANGYIFQLDVLESTAQNWKALINGIRSFTEEIRVNNVDDRLTIKVQSLLNSGLKNHVNQYEMQLKL